MLRFWKLCGQPTWFLYDAPGEGGGGGAGDGDGEGADEDPTPESDHPDFETPAGVGGPEDDEPPAEDPKRPPVKAGERPAGPGPREPVETIPKYRLDETIAERDALKSRVAATDAELAKLKRLVGASLGIVDPDNEGKPRPLTPREQAIQKRMFELVPGLQNILKLSEKTDALASLAESMPDFTKQNEQYWGRVARSMYDGMEAKVAPLFLGDGKTVADMTPAARNRLRTDFANWVQSDPTRADRYEALDQTLIDDYRTELEDTYITPVRRQLGAGALTRSRQVSRLPVSGGSGAPTRTPKPKAEPMDEDAAADAAWKDFQGRMQAGA
jgi:hypothetical protein